MMKDDKAMKRFELVSLDMFQTLVNVNSRMEQIWKPILSDTYTYEAAEECAQLLLSYFFEHGVRLKGTKQFFLTKEIYERSFVNVFEDFNISYDAVAANKILFDEHKLSEFYEDTLKFLDRISKEYKICIISDADDAMIPMFYADYGIHMFTSERYKSYKNDDGNIMFKEMLKLYNIAPEKVVHIGDSVSDIVGAKREGIIACWLNRSKKSWEHEVKPDFVVETLDDLEEIL